MRTSIAFFACVVALSGVTATLNGCSSKEINEDDPAEVYKDAQDDVANDRYLLALEKFRKIRHKFPYSKYSINAQLRIADVYFLQESFAEAASAYEAFHDLHPKHDDAPYAMFRIGESYYKDAPTEIARDEASAQKALDAFQAYLEQFPADKRVKEAKDLIVKIKNMLADKELYIGDFYRIRDFYQSALPRYERIVSLYPDTQAATKAKEYIPKIKPLAEAQRKEAEEERKAKEKK